MLERKPTCNRGLEQGYFIPRTQIVQRIYVQSPKLKGEVYNGIAYASYYTATISE